ncbi:MAG: cupredoxin domain-containing protein [Anaerolineales bacterium]
MKSIKLLPLTCVLALALAGCVGPTPTIAPSVTSGPNTALPPGYPADATSSGPNGPYPAAATPTAATVEATQAEATAAASDTPAEAQATDTEVAPTAIPDTPVPAASATAATVFITYQDFEIVPAQATIKVGTKVVFLIKSASGTNHEPYSTTPPYNFDSGGGLVDGQSYSFTFDKAGTITLLCGYHGNMQATLTIAP